MVPGSVEEAGAVGGADVVEALVLEPVSVEGFRVVGADDDLVGWEIGSGVETGHSDARKEASFSWQLV